MSSLPAPTDRAAETTRQYRSRKRQRPCDRCRGLKLKCEKETQMPCRRCQQNGTDCTFISNSRKRTPAKALNRPETREQHKSSATGRTDLLPLTQESRLGISSTGDTPILEAQHPFEQNEVPTHPPHVLETTPFDSLPQDRPATQISQSLDQMPGCSMMLLGGSSSLDPWLLRHLRFDELGLQSFYKYHIRNAGGVPTFDKIPVHFLLASDELISVEPAQPQVCETGDLRRQLELLVPPFIGVRLVRLFHRHIFPTLPIISRTSLGLTSIDQVPDIELLHVIPTHLLAAIYGSALPFASSDEKLVVPLMHDRVSAEEIWRIAQSCFLEAIRKPHLSVLQSMLLYLHKGKETHGQHAVADTASTWPLMGTMIGLAHNLGLNLECKMMGLPAHEKRLRRRLWWAVYVEDKFLSLLSGRPPYIRHEEWDVGQLASSDFVTRADPETPLPLNESHFMNMARLALIAEPLQGSLYSLRSCQKLAEDLAGSIQAARPMFDALNTWRANTPGLETILEEADATKPTLENHPSCVQFAYLILVTYVWRAVLRPTVRSQPPPPIIHVDQEPEPPGEIGFSFESFNWDFADLPEISLELEEDGAETSATINELYQSALAWARSLVSFVSRLTSRDLGEFWHSWSPLSFVVVSSFLMMLLVQSPTPESARKSKDVLDNWWRLLRDQSRISPTLVLSFAQLSEFYRVGLSAAFFLPSHVQESIDGVNKNL